MSKHVFEMLWGGLEAAVPILTVFFGWVLFRGGRALRASAKRSKHPLLVSCGYAMLAAGCLGLLASRDRNIWEDSDPIYGGGTLVEVIENEDPYGSFGWGFAFSLTLLLFGVLREDPLDDD